MREWVDWFKVDEDYIYLSKDMFDYVQFNSDKLCEVAAYNWMMVKEDGKFNYSAQGARRLARAWNWPRADAAAKFLKKLGESGLLDTDVSKFPTRFSRQAIPQRIKDWVFKRDGKRCVYCEDTEGPFHLDHVMPVSKGGEDTTGNLVVACQPCNMSKGAKTLKQWGGRKI